MASLFSRCSCRSWGALIVLVPALVAGEAATPTGELSLHLWSGKLNVPDPVACTVDPQGRVYVSATTRRKAADLDIREHPMWTAADVGLTSVAEKAAFYRDALAPGKVLRPRGGLADHNQDGSIDWRDLTVHTERIYQLRDTNGDGTADQMTVFAEGFNSEVTGIAAGVLWHDGWLYATIAPDLWRFKDLDDDGVADIREVVAHGFGVHIAYAGHDMHGLSVGPDGRIYWSIGDKGANVTSREGRHFFYPHEGAVFRVEPDGSGFEVYAHGLRNPQEPAFNAWGDLFVVDNDADMEGERERLVYIAEGSDSGWRCTYQYMGLASPWMREGLWRPAFDGQAAYLFPALASYSDGPAGFKFEPGAALSSGQRGHFILTEFPSGKIRGFRVEPEGASFRMVDERVLNTGVMGIGLSWHPDGSLMMVDWIGGYPLDELGAVWRVDAGSKEEPIRRETHDRLRAGFTGLEDEALLALLGHADQRVRLGAQFELVKRDRPGGLMAVAGDPAQPLLARVHSIWGYGQLLRQERVDTDVLLPLLASSDPELRRQTLKVLGDAASARTASVRVLPLLDDPEPRVRFQAALTLGKWKAPAATAALFRMAARDGDDPVLRHAAVVGLTGCAAEQELAARANDPSPAVRLASVVALRRLRSPAVQQFLADEREVVVEEVARAIHDDQSIPDALPALAARLDARGGSLVVQRRALNAAFRLGTGAEAERLLAYALAESAPRELRHEALVVLQRWNDPPALDRVDGWARRLQHGSIRDLLTRQLDRLLALTEPELKTVALQLMLTHELEPSAAQMVHVLEDRGAPAELRAEALRLMARRHAGQPEFQRVLQVSLAPDADDAVLVVAMEQLLTLEPVRFVDVARQAFTEREVVTQQRILQLLAAAALPAADDVLHAHAQQLLAGTFPRALQLDLLEALEVRSDANPILAEARRQHPSSRAELLAGGNVELGREIALNHLGANCLACHRIESDDGSHVGPNLRTIGRDRDVESLLESLIDPGAVLSPGYGFTSVELAGGDSVHGGLVSDTPQAVVIRTLDGSVQTIPRSRITALTPPISIMPPIEGILSPRELRDLVAYLQTLRGERRRRD
jgi:quinoprotein glucose dehydrogenase